MAYGSQCPPIITDGRISRVRFETLAYLPWTFPKRRERGLNAGSYTPPPLLVCPPPRLLKSSTTYRRFYQAGRLDDREDRQVSRAPLPNSGVTSIGET